MVFQEFMKMYWDVFQGCPDHELILCSFEFQEEVMYLFSHSFHCLTF